MGVPEIKSPPVNSYPLIPSQTNNNPSSLEDVTPLKSNNGSDINLSKVNGGKADPAVNFVEGKGDNIQNVLKTYNLPSELGPVIKSIQQNGGTVNPSALQNVLNNPSLQNNFGSLVNGLNNGSISSLSGLLNSYSQNYNNGQLNVGDIMSALNKAQNIANKFDDIENSVNDITKNINDIKDSVKPLTDTINGLKDTTNALQDKGNELKNTKPSDFHENLKTAPPKGISKVIQEKSDIEGLRGDNNFARMPDKTTIRVGVSGEAGSNLSVGNIKSIIANPGQNLPGVLGQTGDIHADARVKAGIKIDTKYFGVDIEQKGVVGVQTSGVPDALKLYQDNKDLPQQFQDISNGFNNLMKGFDSSGFSSNINNLSQQMNDIQQKLNSYKQNNTTPSPQDLKQLQSQLSSIAGTIDNLNKQVESVQGKVTKANELFNQTGQIINRFHDGTLFSGGVEVGGGTYTDIALKGRVPVYKSKRTTISVGAKVDLMVAPSNPYYDPNNKNMPQFKSMLGTAQMRAEVAIRGLDSVKDALNTLQQLSNDFQTASEDIQQVGGQVSNTLNGISGNVGNIADSYANIPINPQDVVNLINDKDVQNLVKNSNPKNLQDLQSLMNNPVLKDPAKQQQILNVINGIKNTNMSDVNAIVNNLQGIADKLKKSGVDKQTLDRINNEINKLKQDGDKLLNDINNVQNNFRVGTGVVLKTREADPNIPGVGLSAGVNLDYKGKKGELVQEGGAYFNVNNIAGYWRGTENIYSLDTHKVLQQAESGEKIDPLNLPWTLESSKKINFYRDVKPLTLQGGGHIGLFSESWRTKIELGGEKVVGGDFAIRQGVQQNISKYFALNAGVTFTGQNGTLYDAGFKVGKENGPISWTTGVMTDAFELDKIKRAGAWTGVTVKF